MRFYCAIAVVTGLLFSLAAPGNAQPSADDFPRVSTQIDPTSGTVGERFILTVEATVPDVNGLEILPLFDTQTTWTETAEAEASDRKTGSNVTRKVSYTIAPFETGQVEIPRVAVTYSSGNPPTSNTVLSSSLWVEINSVLSGNGSASALREVKAPVVLPVPKAVVWGVGLLLALVLALVAYLIWRRYSGKLKQMLGRSLSWPELALAEIDSLEKERLIEQKKIKVLYTRLSDTLRRYLETAYDIPATELTSNELLRCLDEIAEEQDGHSDDFRIAVARLVELLDEADLVKFARFLPEPNRCRKALQLGRDVVNHTAYRYAPVEIPAENKQAMDSSRPGPPPASGQEAHQ